MYTVYTYTVCVWGGGGGGSWDLGLRQINTLNFCKILFCRNQSIWSQEPVTQDFWKSCSIWPIYSILKHFSVGSASDEIVTAYAYLAMKPFSHMLSKLGNHFLVWSARDEIVSAQHAFGCPCKNCQNLNAGGACKKIVRRRLSVQWNRFRVFSAINEILVTYEYVQPAHAISLENS